MFQLWFGGFSREGGKGGGGSPAEEKISSTLTDLYFRPFLWTISAFIYGPYQPLNLVSYVWWCDVCDVRGTCTDKIR